MNGFYINQQALSALTELILMLAVIGPLLVRRNRSRASNDFLGAFASGAFLSVLLLIDALTVGDLPAYAADLWILIRAVAVYFLLAFAFSFLSAPIDPIRALRLRREAFIAQAISVTFIALALLAVLLVLGAPRPTATEAVSRGVSSWSIIALLWGNIVFWRRAAYASMESHPERKPWHQWLWPQGHYGRVAAVMALVGFVPLVLAILLAMQPVASSTTGTAALTIGFLVIRFVGALIYYNYSEETFSILVKLSVTTLAIVLASVSLVGAVVEPEYLEAFQSLNEGRDSVDYVMIQRAYLHERMLPLFWLIIGLSAFILLGSPLFFRYILVVPLNGLMTSVRAVDRGELTTRATVHFPDEIGIVTDSFNRMVASVQHAEEDLEAQVERRTEALAEATTQAQAASQAKSDFLAHMSHELRTPLNGILGYAQILRSETGLSPFQLGGIDVMYASGHHLLTLIDDILDLSRIEADKLELSLADFSLPNLLDGIFQMMNYSAEEKALRFEWTPPPNLPTHVFGDERRLRQVLINLLGNALKFTHDGSVSLQVTRLDDTDDSVARLRFAVADTGIGLSAKQMADIFTPFEQIPQAGMQAPGAGLGLPISQRLVQLMGGEIRVESQVDEGSRFWFDIALPCVEEKAVARQIADGRPSTVAAKRSTQPPSVLQFPPEADLIALYEYARLGDMQLIEVEANRLAGQSEAYRPFADRVLASAANFDDAAILALVQPEIDANARGAT